MPKLLESWETAAWQPAADVARPFVRHLHPEPSPGQVWHAASGRPSLSVVIPTVDAQRGGYFIQLLRQLGCQTWEDFELLVIRGDPRQGRAINIGAALAQGRYLLILDDDTSLNVPDVIARLVAALEADPQIGLAGGNNVTPEHASAFVRRAMRQIPRRSWTPVTEVTESDLAEHPCLMMRTDEFKAVGGENELLPRGLDPYLRQVFRDRGKRVVVVPGVIYSHLPPDSWKGLLQQFVRNGRQAAFVNRRYPQWIIETPDQHGALVEHVPFRRRAVRYLLSLTRSLRSGQWIWFSCQMGYVVGFAAGWLVEQGRMWRGGPAGRARLDRAQPGDERSSR